MELIISAPIQRCGSTLIQRIINSRKENLIWGEHYGILYNFMEIYRKVRSYSFDIRRERENYFTDNENPNTWIATMTPTVTFVEDAVVESVRVFLERLYAQYRDTHEIVGFKEICYGEQELKLLRKCYPDLHMLLLIRDPIQVWKSLKGCFWYKEDLPASMQKWNRNVRGYLSHVKNDSKSYLLLYEDVIRKDPGALDIISNLGKVPLNSIHEVMSNKIGSTAKEEVTAHEREYILEVCSEQMKLLGYL